MSRTFEIFDSRGSCQLSASDLPLAIGSGSAVQIDLGSGQDIEGYIAESRGHLFFQPSTVFAPVYHNDREITASVWIKSGDITRIGTHLIHYSISGDRVEIRVSSAAQKPIVPPDTPHPEASSTDQHIPDIPVQTDKKKPRYRSRLLQLTGLLFLILLVAALFVLTAGPLKINVFPEPDSLAIKGFPPVIKIGQRFLGLRGEYILRAEKKGFKALETPVTIGKEQTANNYNFILEKLPGLVSFFTDPAAAEVYVNGTAYGTTPLNKLKIPAGQHRVRITRDRHLEIEESVTVTGQEHEQRFDYVLAPAWSTVTLHSEPSGAEISINGKQQGITPLSLDLLKGKYVIILQKEEFSPLELKLTVPAGKTITPATAVLTPAPATMELASSPSGASVMVDSDFQGQTPVKLELSSRKEHVLTLSLSGYEKMQQKITLAPGEKKKLSPTLSPEHGIVFLTTGPPDAELFIDGKHRGKATGRFSLTVREHTFVIKAEGYKTVTRKVLPKKEYSRQLEIRLEPMVAQGAKSGNTPVRKAGNDAMIELPPAAFTLGSSGREPGRRANEHLRQVKITRPFQLSAKEVTNAEFRRFKPDHSSGIIAGFSLDGNQQPVVNVTWEDAVRYLNWLSIKDGLEPFYREENNTFVPVKPLTTGYRLPLETEWAYAARYAGNTDKARYPWPGSFPPRGNSGNFADESARSILSIVIKGYNDSYIVTAPVASFPRNMGQFFDIGGNVSEWCHDYYSPYISLAGQTAEDPMGPETGVHHVVRGSSWRDGSITELRLSYRRYGNRARDDIGFRIARFVQ